MASTGAGRETVQTKEKRAFRGVSGNALKLFAMALMLIDHTAIAFYPGPIPRGLYALMRFVARPAFPIFAFMIAVGARKTHDVKKYLLRLFVYALLSELPFDHAFGFAAPDQIVEFRYQNVFFTLFLGLLSVVCLRFFQKKTKLWPLPTAATLLACMAAGYYLRADYGEAGVLCIFLFYVAGELPERWQPTLWLPAAGVLTADLNLSRAPVLLFNESEAFAAAAVVALLFYNGERGVKLPKRAFYLFYPGHLLLLALLRIFLLR